MPIVTIVNSFYAHFLYEHCSVGNWEIIAIDKRRNKQETRRKETFLTT